MPATARAPRWFLDENSLGVALALQHVRGDITWPGAPDKLAPAGATDTTWLPIVGTTGLVVLNRDKRIRTRPIERESSWTTGFADASSPAAATSPCSLNCACGCAAGTTSKRSSIPNRARGWPA